MTNRSIHTKLVQLGNKRDPATGSVNPPIHLSTAYQHQGIGLSTGYDYIRTKNPTRTILEDGIRDLENGDAGYACSSGMAAIQLVLSLFRPGDELICSADIYGGTHRLLARYADNHNIQTIYSELTDMDQTEELLTDQTKAIFIETPTNPLMQEVSIEKVTAFAKKHDLLVIVDNTFLTPYFQQPLDLGADIVIHSATKYIGGHNDVLAGLVAAKGETLCEELAEFHNDAGAVLSPFDSWLLIRGLKTLALRMEKHQKNAQTITTYLESEPLVTDVLYAGKGGMLSFRLADSDMVDPFLQNIQLITFAESLGGVESFITYPATQTHAAIPEEERISRGVCNRLLRFSVGVEKADDIIADLKQVFDILRKGAYQPEKI